MSIAMLAVIRVSDKAVLAKIFEKGVSGDERKALDNTLDPLVQQSCNVAYPGCRGRRQCEGCEDLTMYALVEAQSLCVVVAGVRSVSVPERVAQQFLEGFADEPRRILGEQRLALATSGSLTGQLRPVMREHMGKYADPGSQDKVTQVQQKVHDVKDVMQDNVRKILETHTTLEELEQSSESLNQAATKFQKNATGVKQQMVWRNMALKLLAGGVSVAIITYLFWPLFS